MRIGILGGGQLGRMLAADAHRLGMEPVVLEPKPDCPAAAMARTICADYADPTGLDEMARCDRVTFEFENVPPSVLQQLSERVPVDPCPEALVQTGDRLREKRLFESLGIPTARFHPVDSADGIARASREIEGHAILKTRRFGYDGKGQLAWSGSGDEDQAFRDLGNRPLILEERIAFDREVSLIAVRGRDGEMRFWSPTENRHVDGILRISRAPAQGLDPSEIERAEGWVTALAERLDYVGVLAVEFFVRGRDWLANETACRVHNSGHWTLEGAVTSQFENHLRAVGGLPLGQTRTVEPAAMVNLVGSVPPLPTLLEVPGARVHDYGKTAAPGRKMGHLTITAPTPGEIDVHLRDLVDRLEDPALVAALASGRPPAPDREPGRAD